MSLAKQNYIFKLRRMSRKGVGTSRLAQRERERDREREREGLIHVEG
jgi:hypothetical protein